MKEFDTLRASFLLVAMVIATLMVVVLLAFGSCSILLLTQSTALPVCSDELREFIRELITMSFSAAIAFAAGRLSAPITPPPKFPDKEEKK